MADEQTAIHVEDQMGAHRHTIEALFGGTLAGGLVAIGAGVLAIIGLAGFLPQALVAVATIGVGAAFLFEGASIAARMADLLHEVTEQTLQAGELVMGTTGETLAGIAGVALGILGLLGVLPAILIPSAALVFGAALVIGAGANGRINHLTSMYREAHPMALRVAREALRATTGLQVLAGLAAMTLGILALVGMDPLILSLVAMLSVSVAFLLTDTAVAGRIATVFH